MLGILKKNITQIITATLVAIIGSVTNILAGGGLSAWFVFLVVILSILLLLLLAKKETIVAKGHEPYLFMHGYFGKTDIKEKQNRFNLAVSATIIVIIAGLLPFGGRFQASAPSFELNSHVIHPDSAIVIFPSNKIAERYASEGVLLSIELDEIPFANSGLITNGSQGTYWRFSLLEQGLDPELFPTSEKHYMRIGIEGEAFLDTSFVVIFNRRVFLDAKVLSQEGVQTVQGLAGTDSGQIEDTLIVEIFFKFEGEIHEYSVPVEVVEDISGRTYFAFEQSFQNLPKYEPDTPQYLAPFFGIRVTDVAGISFFQEESYASFMASGTKRFGSLHSADFYIQREQNSDDHVVLTFEVVPQWFDKLVGGAPPFFLTVIAIEGGGNKLSWSNLPPDIHKDKPITEIYRDNQKLGTSFSNSYTDSRVKDDFDHKYQVVQRGVGGFYVSNEATASLFAETSTPTESETSPNRQIPLLIATSDTSLTAQDLSSYLEKISATSDSDLLSILSNKNYDLYVQRVEGPPYIAVDWPDHAIVILQSSLPNLKISSNWHLFEQRYDSLSQSYIVVVDTLRQNLRISESGRFSTIELRLPKLKPKESIYFSVEPKREHY